MAKPPSNPYHPTIIILSVLTLLLFVVVLLTARWFTLIDWGGAAVDESDRRSPRGYAESFVAVLKLTPIVLLVASPVWAIVLIVQAGMLKKRRADPKL